MAELSVEILLERLRDSARRMADRLGKTTASTQFSAIMGVDTLNAIVLGFIFVAAVVIIASNIFNRRKKNSNERNSESKPKVDNQVASGAIGKDDKISKKSVVREEMVCAARVSETLQSKPKTTTTRMPGVPCAKGPDNDYVMWIDNVLQWFHGPKGAQHFHQLEENWLTTLNAQTEIASAEVIIL